MEKSGRRYCSVGGGSHGVGDSIFGEESFVFLSWLCSRGGGVRARYRVAENCFVSWLRAWENERIMAVKRMMIAWHCSFPFSIIILLIKKLGNRMVLRGCQLRSSRGVGGGFEKLDAWCMMCYVGRDSASGGWDWSIGGCGIGLYEILRGG